MKKLIYLSILIILVSCKQTEEPKLEINLTNKIIYGFDDYTSPLQGSTTEYYLGFKFISTTKAIQFKANYTPAVAPFGSIIIPESFNMDTSTINYKITENYILLNKYSGEIYENTWFNITSTTNKIYLFELNVNDKIGKLILSKL